MCALTYKQTNMQALIEGYVNAHANALLQARLERYVTELIDTAGHAPEAVTTAVQNHSYSIVCNVVVSAASVNASATPTKCCLARTGRNKQCTRPVKPDGDGLHCLSHMQSLPYMDITQPFTQQRTIKRRGRKKACASFKTEDLDPRLYVTAFLVNINGAKYLVDEYKVLYDYGSLGIMGYLDDNNKVVCF